MTKQSSLSPSSFSIILAILTVSIIGFSAFVTQPAYAVSVTRYTTGAFTNPNAATIINGMVAIADGGTNTLYLMNMTTGAQIRTVSITGATSSLYVYGGYLYAGGGSALDEIDASRGIVTRTIAITANAAGQMVGSNYYFVGSNAFKHVDVSQGTWSITTDKTYSLSTDCNGGGSSTYLSDTGGWLLTCSAASGAGFHLIELWNSTFSKIANVTIASADFPNLQSIAVNPSASKAVTMPPSGGTNAKELSYTATTLTISDTISGWGTGGGQYPMQFSGGYLVEADDNNDALLVRQVATQYPILSSTALRYSDTGGITTKSVFVSNDNIIVIGNAGSASRWFVASLSGLSNGTVATSSVCVQINNSGNCDMVLTVGPNGMPNFDPNNYPMLAQPAQTAVQNLFQAFGMSQTASQLMVFALMHVIFIGALAAISFKSHVQPPMFVWAFIMILAGGISAALGMNLIYFFAELVAVVGGMAFMMSRGFGQ